MKRYISLFLSFLIVLNLSGCAVKKEKSVCFDEIEYERCDFDNKKEKLKIILDDMQVADKYMAQAKAYEDWEKQMDDIINSQTYVEVRFNMDTKDKIFANEKEVYDENIPDIISLDNEFLSLMLSSPFKESFKDIIGEGYFEDLENASKVLKSDISDLKSKENKLITEFDTLEAKAGEEILKKFKILVQNKRIKQANKLSKSDVLYCFYKAKNDYYYQNKLKYGQIFMSLIDLRKEIASRTNCKNYAEFCYILSNRSSYNQNDVKKFRDNIKKYITPVYKNLCDKKAKALNAEKLPYYYLNDLLDVDEPMLKHNDGKLTGEILAYNISPLTKDCLKTLTKYNFMDLDRRDNKATGAFTTSFPKYNMPFIFATTDDSLDSVNTFIHEFGHAYNYFSNRDNDYNSDRSLDISEIHSHSMEILSLNFYDEILKTDPDEAIADYMQDLLTLLLTTALNDEFQEEIYTKDIYSIDDANKIYKRLQQEYFGDFDYLDLNYYNEGGIYSAISHIYTRPFYMIDYALAVCVAMQIWDIQKDNYEEAFEKYQDLTTTDKNLSFSQILEKNKLKNPIFDEECLSNIAKNFNSILFKYIM